MKLFCNIIFIRIFEYQIKTNKPNPDAITGERNHEIQRLVQIYKSNKRLPSGNNKQPGVFRREQLEGLYNPDKENYWNRL